MTKINKDDEQSPLLVKVFTRWISTELKGVQNVNINDITKDLSNGVALVELAQILTRKKAPRAWDEQPASTVQNVKNCKLAFKMFRNDGFRPIGITSKSISDNNEKQIIDYIWQLISYYSINNSFSKLEKSKENISDSNIKNKLLSWAIRRTQNYKQIFAFKPYDLAICALLDSYYPSKIKYYVQDLKDHKNNFKHAIDVMNELSIPCLILPEDLNQNNSEIDKKELLTQLAFVRLHLEVKPRAKPKRRAISVLQPKPIPNPKSPANTTSKKLISNNDRLIHTHIPKRKAKSELKPRKEFSAYPPIIARQKKLIKNINDFNADKDDTGRPNRQQNVENEIIEDFNEDKEAYEERKLEEKEESKIEEEKEALIEDKIDQEFKENEALYKERKKTEKKPLKKINKKEEKIEKKIIDDFNQDKEAFKERKLEEKEEEKIEDEKEEPIEEEIDQEFKENEKAYKERKEEEKNSKKLTKDQIKIEKEINNDFKENRLANQKRKKEEKIEKDELKKEELRREGITNQNDRRPTFINFV